MMRFTADQKKVQNITGTFKCEVRCGVDHFGRTASVQSDQKNRVFRRYSVLKFNYIKR